MWKLDTIWTTNEHLCNILIYDDTINTIWTLQWQTTLQKQSDHLKISMFVQYKRNLPYLSYEHHTDNVTIIYWELIYPLFTDNSKNYLFINTPLTNYITLTIWTPYWQFWRTSWKFEEQADTLNTTWTLPFNIPLTVNNFNSDAT